MARIIDKALRGEKALKEEEKLKALKEKHKRPKNVQNLQTPKVAEFAWREMKREVKRVDFALQKGIMDCGQAITPLAKAFELLQSNKDPETARGYVMDAFIILSLNIKATNLKRLNLIKRGLKPKYRDLCPEEPSATKLLGDNFQEVVKKLDGTKGHITLTSQNFLGKRGGGGGDRHQSSFNHNHHNFNRRNYNQNYQGYKYQNKGAKPNFNDNRNHNRTKNQQSTRK